jgi:hypothetical protein
MASSTATVMAPDIRAFLERGETLLLCICRNSHLRTNVTEAGSKPSIFVFFSGGISPKREMILEVFRRQNLKEKKPPHSYVWFSLRKRKIWKNDYRFVLYFWFIARFG